ncbi:MAG: hypothetical protein COT74_02325 [Bdellovibrionales bacterium CG10_big_fil_rev_8_21_14_0_10_45_34]|nr:MAG: hypothetical protein COT74_02325 [Bdellovibrionales bacterium CG10_big_fil_rev_8_21_14_0_10_45_34]
MGLSRRQKLKTVFSLTVVLGVVMMFLFQNLTTSGPFYLWYCQSWQYPQISDVTIEVNAWHFAKNDETQFFIVNSDHTWNVDSPDLVVRGDGLTPKASATFLAKNFNQAGKNVMVVTSKPDPVRLRSVSDAELLVGSGSESLDTCVPFEGTALLQEVEKLKKMAQQVLTIPPSSPEFDALYAGLAEGSPVIEVTAAYANCGTLAHGQSQEKVEGNYSPEPQQCPNGGNLTYTYQKLVNRTCNNGQLVFVSERKGQLVASAGQCNPPSIQFTVNGLKNITVDPLSKVNYAWSSQGVATVTSTYSATKSFCGVSSFGAWEAKTTSGAISSALIQTCQAGIAFTLTVRGVSSTGQVVTSSVVVNVRAPKPTLKINATGYTVGQQPTYTVSGAAPNEKIFWRSTKDYYSTGETASYYGHITDATGSWSGKGGIFTSSDAGNWMKEVTIGGRASSVNFQVKNASTYLPLSSVGPTNPTIDGVNSRGVIGGIQHMEVFGTFSSSGNSVLMNCTRDSRSVSITYQSASQINIAWTPKTTTAFCSINVSNSKGTSNAMWLGFIN